MGTFIPRDIWCTRELSGDEKLMWGETVSLDNERKPQRVIKALKDKGYITVEICKQDNSRVICITGRYSHLDKEHMAD